MIAALTALPALVGVGLRLPGCGGAVQRRRDHLRKIKALCGHGGDLDPAAGPRRTGDSDGRRCGRALAPATFSAVTFGEALPEMPAWPGCESVVHSTRFAAPPLALRMQGT
jgi:hypothetical protein